MKVVDSALEEGRENEFFRLFGPITDRMFIDRIKPVYSGVAYSESEKDLAVDRYGKSHGKRIVCPQPFYMLSVWTNGDVAPCDALYKACPLGNVKTDTLKSMWNSQKRICFCRRQLNGERKKIKECARCCAPEDVQHEEDVLDARRLELLERF